MAKQFTFKDHHPTGRYRSFDHMYTEIKFEKMQCGTIHELEGFNNWSISFMIKRPAAEITPASPCSFKHVTLKHKPQTLAEAKSWLKESTEAIRNRWDLHYMEAESK
jgi:hypothetical protein